MDNDKNKATEQNTGKKPYTNFKKPYYKKEGYTKAPYKKDGYKKDFDKKDTEIKDIRTKGSDTKIAQTRSTDTRSTDTRSTDTRGADTKAPYNKTSYTKAPYNKSSYKKDTYRKSVSTEQVVEEVALDENIIFGRNCVMEVLKAERDIDKILIQKGELEGSILKIIGDAKQKGIVVQEVDKIKLDEITNMERHQGVVAYVSAKQYVTIDEILDTAKVKGEDPFVLILENIQDPHNLGAIIRTAHNAGVHGIIIPKRRAVGLTGTVSKASAGALEYMNIAKVTNIAQTIEELKEKGIWVACADMDGEIIYTDNMKGSIGIVIGSEGEGVSRNVKAKCDFVVSIPMYGKVTSLNASVAASLMVYEVVRQRHF